MGNATQTSYVGVAQSRLGQSIDVSEKIGLSRICLKQQKNSYHFESSINLSPHLWGAQCWIVAQGRGLFTHVDLDKKYSRSVTM